GASAIIHIDKNGFFRSASTIQLVVSGGGGGTGGTSCKSVHVGPTIGKKNCHSYYVRRWRNTQDLIKSILQAGLGESAADEGHPIYRIRDWSNELGSHCHVDCRGRRETDLRNVVNTLVEIALEAG